MGLTTSLYSDCRFVPDLEDIVQFEELVTGTPDAPSPLPEETTAAARYALTCP